MYQFHSRFFAKVNRNIYYFYRSTKKETSNLNVISMACLKCSGKGSCNVFFLPLNDLMSVLNGKWKMRIILCLAFEAKHFNEIKKCHEVSPRILSKELKELEINAIIKRTEIGDNLRSVIYSLTEPGEELVPIIMQLQKWGTSHRQNILSSRSTIKI